MLAAESVPGIEGIALPVLVAGTLLLLLYVAARIGGRDPLPEGPSPEVPFKVHEVLLILIGNVMLQVTAFSLVVNLGIATGTHARLLSYVGPVGIVLCAHQFALKRRKEHGPRLKGALAGVAAWLASYPLVLVTLLAWATLLAEFGTGWQEQEVLTTLRADPLTFFLVAVVLAPLVEEVLYRGLLYPTLKRKWGKAVGLLVSAGLFAILHSHAQTLAALFVLGLVLGHVYERTGTLAAPMALHAAFNGFTFVGAMIERAAGS